MSRLVDEAACEDGRKSNHNLTEILDMTDNLTDEELSDLIETLVNRYVELRKQRMIAENKKLSSQLEKLRNQK